MPPAILKCSLGFTFFGKCSAQRTFLLPGLIYNACQIQLAGILMRAKRRSPFTFSSIKMPANSSRLHYKSKHGSIHNQDDNSIPIGALSRNFKTRCIQFIILCYNFQRSLTSSTMTKSSGHDAWLAALCPESLPTDRVIASVISSVTAAVPSAVTTAVDAVVDAAGDGSLSCRRQEKGMSSSPSGRAAGRVANAPRRGERVWLTGDASCLTDDDDRVRASAGRGGQRHDNATREHDNAQ